MGKFDAEITQAKGELATAQDELRKSLIKLVDADPVARELVLDQRRKKVDELRETIASLENAED